MGCLASSVWKMEFFSRAMNQRDLSGGVQRRSKRSLPRQTSSSKLRDRSGLRLRRSRSRTKQRWSAIAKKKRKTGPHHLAVESGAVAEVVVEDGAEVAAKVAVEVAEDGVEVEEGEV